MSKLALKPLIHQPENKPTPLRILPTLRPKTTVTGPDQLNRFDLNRFKNSAHHLKTETLIQSQRPGVLFGNF